MYAWPYSRRLVLDLTNIQISHYLIQGATKQRTLHQDRKVLYGDAIGMIVAGRDALPKLRP